MHFPASIVVVSSFLALALNARAQDSDHEHHSRDGDARSLGHVSFANSGNAAAQKPFIEGLALIHSFEYPRAVTAFQAAEKADPKFALPYWMEALTNTQLLWGIDDTVSARKVLGRLAPTSSARLALARTPREKAFASAVEAFYASGTPQERASRFADSLRSWTRRMPADDEANAFAALGILWQADFLDGEAAGKLKTEAAKHAQLVFDHNPQHPGAAHYIIHATDAPATAQLGLRAALEYSRIAPDAEHALHMPSHIFLPLGMWTELATANERAWKASRADAARQKSDDPWSFYDFHSLNWLQYAYLQQGRWREARALIDTARNLTAGMSGKIKPADDPDAALAAEQLSFRYASETGDWSAFAPTSTPVDIQDSTISQRALFMGGTSLYQRAVADIKSKHDSTAAVSALQIFRKTRPFLAQFVEVELVNERGTPEEKISALEKIRPKVRVDRYASMTPSGAMNIDEELGAALVAAGRASEAVKVYREALADRPRRAASLLGLARAQDAAGDHAGARATYAELSKMWSHADANVRANLAGTVDQDPAVVNPSSIRVKLENDSVRVMEATLPPGFKEKLHHHPSYVMYILAGGKVRLHTADGKARDAEFKAGDVFFSEPVTHWAENTGTTTIRVILFELRRK